MERLQLGKRLHAVRKSRGLTAEALAELCHINATYLRQIEGGGKLPSLPVFVSLCNALHISPDYLLQDDLDHNELTDITELNTLWKAAAPDQQALAAAILRALLTHLSENK